MLPGKIIVHNPSPAKIAEIARSVRERSDLSQMELAEKVGIKRSAISAREVSKNGLSRLDNIEEHFNALGYEVKLFLIRKEIA